MSEKRVKVEREVSEREIKVERESILNLVIENEPTGTFDLQGPFQPALHTRLLQERDGDTRLHNVYLYQSVA